MTRGLEPPARRLAESRRVASGRAGARRAAAARAQRDADTIGWIGGESIGRQALDVRLAALRSSPRAGALPAVGSSEDRQLVRWTAHVLFTEEICRREARRRGLAGAESTRCRTRPLDSVDAVQLGSVNAAAWQQRPEVSVVFEVVAPPARDSDADPSAGGHPTTLRWRRVSHAVAADPEQASRQPLRPIGWTTLDDLPRAFADLLRTAPVGEQVGPAPSPLGWHVGRVEEIAARPSSVGPVGIGGRLREFARWLDRRRAESLRCAEGFEHPGDPAQPDNTHRH